MCTVTFIKLNDDDFILTSNRDEQTSRETIFPKIYEENKVKLLFPKDKLAGGTWIGASSQKRIVCLLNGGFKNHKKLKKYKFSRGVIVKQALLTKEILPFLENFDFSNLEPFTLIIVDWNIKLNLFELIWDGKNSHLKKLRDKTKIWSSSTLYNEKMKNTRNKWFTKWLNKNSIITEKEILNFHHSKFGDNSSSILMKRPTIQTVSITSINKTNNTLTMTYEDILTHKTIKKSYIMLN